MTETHRSFTISFILHAVGLADRTAKSRAAKQFYVDVRRVQEWCKQKDLLFVKKEFGESSKKRFDGGGRKAPYDYEDMEEILFEWVIELWSRNLRVSR